MHVKRSLSILLYILVILTEICVIGAELFFFLTIWCLIVVLPTNLSVCVLAPELSKCHIDTAQHLVNFGSEPHIHSLHEQQDAAETKKRFTLSASFAWTHVSFCVHCTNHQHDPVQWPSVAAYLT